jgi:hypothetical protein
MKASLTLELIKTPNGYSLVENDLPLNKVTPATITQGGSNLPPTQATRNSKDKSSMSTSKSKHSHNI